jgi:hypothetical protein
MALAEALEVNTVETFLSFINATPDQRRQLLDLAGALGRLDEVEQELGDPNPTPSGSPTHDDADGASARTDGESTEADRDGSGFGQAAHRPAPKVPLHRFEDLFPDGELVRLESRLGSERPKPNNPHGAGFTRKGTSAGRAAAGTDLSELDQLGMSIVFAFEQRRLASQRTAILPGEAPIDGAEVILVDVSSPAKIAAAIEQSMVVKRAFEQLADNGVSELHPGFDILSINRGEIDRMIELKSSGVDAQVQAMSWNEWKTAGGRLRSHFWLYLAGNLRADLPNAAPFLRAVQDPFGTLASAASEDVIRKRTIQLRVREFAAADQLIFQTRLRRGEGQPS